MRWLEYYNLLVMYGSYEKTPKEKMKFAELINPNNSEEAMRLAQDKFDKKKNDCKGKKTAKCKNCGGRVKLHDYLNAFEKTLCFTCRVKFKVAADLIGGRERNIIFYRLGLEGDHKTHTLEETGQKFYVTRERIRQIEYTTLEKINNLLKVRRFLRHKKN